MHDKGRLRTVAVIEFIKGVVVLALGLGLLSGNSHLLLDGGLALLHALAIDASVGPGRQFLSLLQVADREHGVLVAAAFSYALLRFVEAYGLWRVRNWARWLGLVSAGLYVPFEIYYFVRTPGAPTGAVLLVNLLILWLLWPRRTPDRAAPSDSPFDHPGKSA